MADPPRLQGRDIVCIGFADWDTDLQTNQHHLMKRLALENRVLFVESLGLRRPQLAGRDVRRILRRVVRGLGGSRTVDVRGLDGARTVDGVGGPRTAMAGLGEARTPSGLHVLSPLVLPLHANPLARRVNAWLLPRLVRRAARKLGMTRPILWSYVPQAETLVAALQPELVVYHCVDDIAAQPGIDGPSFRASEARFAARAELVLASAPSLAERLGALSRNVLYVPNVADVELFAQALQERPDRPWNGRPAAPADRLHGSARDHQVGYGIAVRAGQVPARLVIRAGRPNRARRPARRHVRAGRRAQCPPAGGPSL